tara:strand:- start:373 stop:1065 length:693 start_codon:yes stop_codon:yes gene_type:complete
MQIKYSIILPCYNEFGNLKLLIPKILKLMRGRNFEVLVVDDNSSDQTIYKLRNIFKDRVIKYYIRKKNRSLGLSIKEGIEKSQGIYVIVMDTDFNHKPSDLKKMLSCFEINKVDMVCGSRFIKGGYSSSTFRHFSSLIFNSFLNFITRGNLSDNLSGFFILKKKHILKPFNKIFYGYGEYYIRLLYFLQKKKIIVKEIPVKYGKRKYGVSKSKLVQMLFTYTFHAIKLVI